MDASYNTTGLFILSPQSLCTQHTLIVGKWIWGPKCKISWCKTSRWSFFPYNKRLNLKHSRLTCTTSKPKTDADARSYSCFFSLCHFDQQCSRWWLFYRPGSQREDNSAAWQRPLLIHGGLEEGARNAPLLFQALQVLVWLVSTIWSSPANKRPEFL